MSHGPHRFREAEMRRAIKAAHSAGIEIARLEIGTDGRIVVVPSKAVDPSGDGLNPWDEVIDAAEQKRPS